MPNAARTLLWLLAVAFVVSVVHYVDNYVNYEDYPQPGPGDDLPAPSAALVGASWFVFTAFGAAAVWLWFRGRITMACVALTVYSLSGLVGIGHYLVSGATDMVWWRQTHVVVDIACGVAIFGFALWAVLRLPGRIARERSDGSTAASALTPARSRISPERPWRVGRCRRWVGDRTRR